MFTNRYNQKLQHDHQWKKNFGKVIDFDIKHCKENIKLSTGQGEDYTRRCLLDYNYIKNNDGLMAVDISRKKELVADPKKIQQIEFVRQLKKTDANDNAIDTDHDLLRLF